ncbi:hypothetical protein [Flavobacterium aquatile]|uniref:hypothetical protein n=1 Tax=Flavobacterium aquatile TaxID=245 RepID=UPI0006921975|nr:hypothetical protein [Flavobacterium aquatile]OXA66749.1 hypothetical protein B0A61_11150 [Flavobacterium aquatile LMG 4008 = ATCC 11947]GEC78385.1 hypothetical protein FAQ01_12550 [Flavobacterium aquatile]
MRKTVLIPTDFTVQSLNILKSVLSTNESNVKLDIILLHGLSLNDSIRDLLFSSKYQQIESLTTPEFEEACEVIKNKFDSQISSLRIDLFTGYNVAAFNNYLEGNRVVDIYVSDKKPVFTNKKSFDLSRFIEKSSANVITVDAIPNANFSEKGKVAEVFNQMSMG